MGEANPNLEGRALLLLEQQLKAERAKWAKTAYGMGQIAGKQAEKIKALMARNVELAELLLVAHQRLAQPEDCGCEFCVKFREEAESEF